MQQVNRPTLLAENGSITTPATVSVRKVDTACKMAYTKTGAGLTVGNDGQVVIADIHGTENGRVGCTGSKIQFDPNNIITQSHLQFLFQTIPPTMGDTPTTQVGSAMTITNVRSLAEPNRSGYENIWELSGPMAQSNRTGYENVWELPGPMVEQRAEVLSTKTAKSEGGAKPKLPTKTKRKKATSATVTSTSTTTNDHLLGAVEVKEPTVVQRKKLAALVDPDQSSKFKTVTVIKAIECPTCEEDIMMEDLEKHMSNKHPGVSAIGTSRLSRFKSLTYKLMAPKRHAEAAAKRQAESGIKNPKLQSARSKGANLSGPRK